MSDEADRMERDKARAESVLLGIARCQDREDKFALNQLPLPHKVNLPTVTLHREQLHRFRDQYTMLLEFAAVVCGVEKTELAPIHMMAHLFARAKPTPEVGEAPEGGGA